MLPSECFLFNTASLKALVEAWVILALGSFFPDQTLSSGPLLLTSAPGPWPFTPLSRADLILQSVPGFLSRGLQTSPTAITQTFSQTWPQNTNLKDSNSKINFSFSFYFLEPPDPGKLVSPQPTRHFARASHTPNWSQFWLQLLALW